MSVLSSWVAGGPLITDGAWGTQLQNLGLAPGELILEVQSRRQL